MYVFLTETLIKATIRGFVQRVGEQKSRTAHPCGERRTQSAVA